MNRFKTKLLHLIVCFFIVPVSVEVVESKWDNLSRSKNDKITIRKEQELRHRIFSWYIVHWDKKFSNKWDCFVKEHQYDFQKEFQGKIIAPIGSLLATNLEFLLNKLIEHCKGFSSEDSIKNVLLLFYNKDKSTPPSKIYNIFKMVIIDYSQDIVGNFITFE